MEKLYTKFQVDSLRLFELLHGNCDLHALSHPILTPVTNTIDSSGSKIDKHFLLHDPRKVSVPDSILTAGKPVELCSEMKCDLRIRCDLENQGQDQASSRVYGETIYLVPI